MKKFYLYKIENNVNSKIYIGITSRPQSRLREHKNKNSKCSKLRKAMDKYGRDNFYLKILAVGDEEYVLDLEAKAIVAYDSVNNGYNILASHPNKIGVSMPEESRKAMSKSLREFYKNNPGHLKDRKRTLKRVPVFVSGFWFPDKNCALNSLSMNEKSFYKRRSEGTLGEVCHPQKKSISHCPIYVLGFWFPDTPNAVASLNKTKDEIQTLLRKNDLEQELKVVGTKPRKKPNTGPLGVNRRENGKYRTKLIFKGKVMLSKTFDSELDAVMAYDNCYEDLYGTRPNNTERFLEEI